MYVYSNPRSPSLYTPKIKFSYTPTDVAMHPFPLHQRLSRSVHAAPSNQRGADPLLDPRLTNGDEANFPVFFTLEENAFFGGRRGRDVWIGTLEDRWLVRGVHMVDYIHHRRAEVSGEERLDWW